MVQLKRFFFSTLFLKKILTFFKKELESFHTTEDLLKLVTDVEKKIKKGLLHENRILGIFLKYHLEGKKKIATGEIEVEYKRYFREIARSTTSTYLNMLKLMLRNIPPQESGGQKIIASISR